MSSNKTWSTKWITCKTCQLNSNHTHCFVNENSHTSNHKATTTKYIICNCLPLKQRFKVPNPGNYANRVRGNKNLIEKKKKTKQNKTKQNNNLFVTLQPLFLYGSYRLLSLHMFTKTFTLGLKTSIWSS